ncbi:MAG: hypothetical protein JWQ87_5303 [Candidatus Sulfotelmatobacter sp.]|nr:hypothetical protein [Candidatus Sulfotelmatobacter sp.]
MEATSTLQHVRLNSAIGYIYQKDMLTGRQQEIHAREIVSWRRSKTAAASATPGCVKTESPCSEVAVEVDHFR